MALMVLDPIVERQLKAEREASGADRYDEVWEGVYMMAPLADNEHQDLQLSLGAIFQFVIVWAGLGRAQAGANVSDRDKGWEHNYRIPDVVVVFPGSAARDCGTHWCGGPDFAIEILSPGDRSRQKLDFYARIGVRELLLVGREPWELELFRLASGRLEPVGRSDESTPDTLASNVVPVSFRLVPGMPRPKIEVIHEDGVQRWIF
jgi:Uma2 family endonuclease